LFSFQSASRFRTLKNTIYVLQSGALMYAGPEILYVRLNFLYRWKLLLRLLFSALLSQPIHMLMARQAPFIFRRCIIVVAFLQEEKQVVP